MLKAYIRLRERLYAVLKDPKGISSLEYGVLAVGILAAVATAAGLVGKQMTALFANIVTELGG